MTWACRSLSLFIPLLFVRGIAGCFSAPLHPGAARSVSLWLPLTSRSTANGLVTAGALIGIAVTAPGFGWLMDQFDWPSAFMISGGAMMAFSVVWFLFATDDAAGHPRANAAEKHLVALKQRASVRNTSFPRRLCVAVSQSRSDCAGVQLCGLQLLSVSVLLLD